MPTTLAQLIAFINSYIFPNNSGLITANRLSLVFVTAVTLIWATFAPISSLPVCESSTKYNFNSTGTADNSPAFAAWLAGLGGAPGCLHFSSGTFDWNFLQSYTPAANQSITILGEGAATELYSVGVHGLFNITYPANLVGGPNPLSPVLTIKGVRITTDQPATTSTSGTQTAITINGNSVPGASVPPTVVSDVTFEGHTLTSDWGTRLLANNVANLQSEHFRVNALCILTGCTDIGIRIHGDIGNHPSNFVIDKFSQVRGGVGIEMDGDLEGLFVTTPVMSGVNFGVVATHAGTSGNGIVKVTGGHIDAITQTVDINGFTDSGVDGVALYQGAYAGMPANSPMIKIENGSLNIKIVNNTAQGFNATGTRPNFLEIDNSQHGVISDNNMNALNSMGVLNSSTTDWTGTGNNLTGTPQTSPPTILGDGNNIEYKQVSMFVFDSGTNTQFQLNHGAANGSTLSYTSQIIGSAGGVPEWKYTLAGPGQQTGNNVGGDSSWTRFSDIGNQLDVPLLLRRENGNAEMQDSLWISNNSSTTHTEKSVIVMDPRACPTSITGEYVICGDPLGMTVLSPGGGIVTFAPVPVTFASLGLCNAAHQGSSGFITDGTSSTFWAAGAGGGATPIRETCDGTIWRNG